MEDHETECDEGVEHAISGDVNNDIGTDQDGEQEELFCRVCDPVDEDIGDEAEEESEVQRPLRDPGMPTRREVLEHNLTHLPPRPWCPHCVKGKGKDTPSLTLKGSLAESLVPRISLDYCFLAENELGRDETTEGDAVIDNPDKVEGDSQTVLVMQESECRSVWSYAVDSKGSSEEWVIHQICEDIHTVGLKDDRIIIKDDQEPAIIDVAKQIALNRGGRFGTAMDNS